MGRATADLGRDRPFRVGDPNWPDSVETGPPGVVRKLSRLCENAVSTELHGAKLMTFALFLTLPRLRSRVRSFLWPAPNLSNGPVWRALSS